MAALTTDSCVSLMQGTLVRPSARYPASIVTDESLKVATNRVQVSLVRSVGSGDTLWTFADTSRLVANMLLSIDNEIVSVTSINGNTVTVVRGFDGTIPTPHAPGRVTSANIVAWHHNALVAEVEAIEQALGPNLSNIAAAGGGVTLASKYVWAQSPAGTLTGGSVNTITLAPVPIGVNGSDKGHWLYVSGGTGTAEPVLIVGGTAVSGAPSGTILFTPVNNHTGSWSISTATSGAQEALQQSCYTPNTYGIVYYGPGGIYNWAPVVLNKDRVGISGAGLHVSMVVMGTPNTDFIQAGDGVATISGVSVANMTLTPNFAGANTSGYGVNVRRAGGTRIDNIRVYGASQIWRGIHIAEMNYTDVFHCLVENTVDHAIHIEGTAGFVNTAVKIWQTVITHPGSDGIYIGDYANANYVYACEINGATNGYCVNINPTAGIATYAHFIRNNDITAAVADGGVNAGGVHASPFCSEVDITDNQILGGQTARPCVLIEAGIARVIGCTIKQNFDRAAIENNSAAIIADNFFNGSSVATSSVKAGPTSILTNVSGNAFYQMQGVPIRIDNAAVNVNITGNTCHSNFEEWSGNPVRMVAAGNLKADTDIPLITSAAAVTIGASPMYQVGGTTAILTINGGWEGRKIHLIKPNAGDVTIGGGGNIPALRTLTAFTGHMDLVYTQGSWY